MDRRDFFRTVFITPLLTPFLLSSHSTKNDALYLIDNAPESILPTLLKEMEKWGFISGRRYSFREEHPHKEDLVHALKKSGWSAVSSLENAPLVLSFRPLQDLALPSFTLVRSGRIWDIRSSHLYSLWKERNVNHAPSNSLTIFSFQANSSEMPRGETVRICMNGDKTEELCLKKDQERTFKIHSGFISIRVQGGKVWVLDSSCPQKICCSAFPVSTTRERIVCAPNHFFLEVLGPRLVDTIIG